MENAEVSPTRPEIRASDSEREEMTERLTAACAEGRLSLEELGERVEAVARARTHGELEAVVSDLPAAAREPRTPARKHRRRTVIALMGSARRRGRWTLPARLLSLCVMGETVLDLRSATIEAPECEMTLVVVMGSTRVIVPDGLDVEVSGFVVMGERRDDLTHQSRPGAPRLTIRVLGAMGEARVSPARREKGLGQLSA